MLLYKIIKYIKKYSISELKYGFFGREIEI